MIAASRGYRFVCVTDTRCNLATKRLMEALGAEVHTIVEPAPDLRLPRCAPELREGAAPSPTGSFVWLNQYSNSNAWRAHFRTTGARRSPAQFPGPRRAVRRGGHHRHPDGLRPLLPASGTGAVGSWPSTASVRWRSAPGPLVGSSRGSARASARAARRVVHRRRGLGRGERHRPLLSPAGRHRFPFRGIHRHRRQRRHVLVRGATTATASSPPWHPPPTSASATSTPLTRPTGAGPLRLRRRSESPNSPADLVLPNPMTATAENRRSPTSHARRASGSMAPRTARGAAPHGPRRIRLPQLPEPPLAACLYADPTRPRANCGTMRREMARLRLERTSSAASSAAQAPEPRRPTALGRPADEAIVVVERDRPDAGPAPPPGPDAGASSKAASSAPGEARHRRPRPPPNAPSGSRPPRRRSRPRRSRWSPTTEPPRCRSRPPRTAPPPCRSPRGRSRRRRSSGSRRPRPTRPTREHLLRAPRRRTPAMRASTPRAGRGRRARPRPEAGARIGQASTPRTRERLARRTRAPQASTPPSPTRRARTRRTRARPRRRGPVRLRPTPAHGQAHAQPGHAEPAPGEARRARSAHAQPGHAHPTPACVAVVRFGCARPGADGPAHAEPGHAQPASAEARRARSAHPNPGTPTPRPSAPQSSGQGTPSNGTADKHGPNPGPATSRPPNPGPSGPHTPKPGTPAPGPSAPRASGPVPPKPAPHTPNPHTPNPGTPNPGPSGPHSPRPHTPNPGTPNPGTPTPHPSAPRAAGPHTPNPGTPARGHRRRARPAPTRPAPLRAGLVLGRATPAHDPRRPGRGGASPRGPVAVAQAPMRAPRPVTPATTRLTVVQAPAPAQAAGAASQIAAVFAEVLEVRVVGVDAHFFDDLGADSMLMARFCAKLRKRPTCLRCPSRTSTGTRRSPTWSGAGPGRTTARPALWSGRRHGRRARRGAQVDKVSVDAHFFDDLGADSMLMARFCAKLRKRDDLPTVPSKTSTGTPRSRRWPPCSAPAPGPRVDAAARPAAPRAARLPVPATGRCRAAGRTSSSAGCCSGVTPRLPRWCCLRRRRRLRVGLRPARPCRTSPAVAGVRAAASSWAPCCRCCSSGCSSAGGSRGSSGLELDLPPVLAGQGPHPARARWPGSPAPDLLDVPAPARRQDRPRCGRSSRRPCPRAPTCSPSERARSSARTPFFSGYRAVDGVIQTGRGLARPGRLRRREDRARHRHLDGRRGAARALVVAAQRAVGARGRPLARLARGARPTSTTARPRHQAELPAAVPAAAVAAAVPAGVTCRSPSACRCVFQQVPQLAPLVAPRPPAFYTWGFYRDALLVVDRVLLRARCCSACCCDDRAAAAAGCWYGPTASTGSTACATGPTGRSGG